MRLPMITGNWKMNAEADRTVELATRLRRGIAGVNEVEVVVCPPFVSLIPVKNALKESSIKLGAQNVCYEEDQGYTGEISPKMLTGLCEYVILGHSDRRQHFGDTDDVVNRKMAAVSRTALRPILCVGEGLKEREAGKTSEVIARQLTSALVGVSCTGPLTVAYEPIWAMDTGKAIRGKQANAAAQLIRNALANLYGSEAAETVRVLYGGSITADNVSEFIEQSEIDGALVGKASLEADQFADIAHLAEYIYFPNNPPTKDLIPW